MHSSRDAADKLTRLFDIRTIERNIKKGLTTRKDYEKHLKALADAAAKVAPVDDDGLDNVDDIDHREDEPIAPAPVVISPDSLDE